MTRTRRRKETERRRCRRAETTSCTSSRCPGKSFSPSSLPQVRQSFNFPQSKKDENFDILLNKPSRGGYLRRKRRRSLICQFIGILLLSAWEASRIHISPVIMNTKAKVSSTKQKKIYPFSLGKYKVHKAQ